jgi:hypothetical protein
MMGRMIVLKGDDLNSKRVKLALEKQSLPYNKVSILRCQAKQEALKALTLSKYVP